MRVPPKPGCSHCGQPKPPGRGRKLCDACSAQWRHRITAKRCLRCNGPCPPRKILCADCKELAAWKRNRRRQRRRKPCIECGGPKPPGPRRRLCDRCLKRREQPALCAACKTRPRRYRTAQLCEPCKYAAEQKLLARNRERNRLYRQARREQGRPMPRRKAVAADVARMNHRLRRERAGDPIAAVPADEYATRYGTGRSVNGRLDAAPLRRLLTEAFDLNAVADAAGLSDSFVVRVAYGKYDAQGIAVPDADRLCIALNTTLSLVYPEAA